MTAGVLDLDDIEQGATYVRTFTWKTQDGPVDLNDWDLICQFRGSYADDDIRKGIMYPALELTMQGVFEPTGGGIRYTGFYLPPDQEPGVFIMHLSAMAFDVFGKESQPPLCGVYDIEAVCRVDDCIVRLVQGRYRVSKEVTHPGGYD